jgi:hypothetical protein
MAPRAPYGLENCSQFPHGRSAVAVFGYLASQFRNRIRGGYDEYFFLPEALAVLDPRAAAPLVGSEEASEPARANQRRLRATQRLTRICVCEGRLTDTRFAFEKPGPRAGFFIWLLLHAVSIEANL